VTATHYDIHIDPVMARDEGVYTCVDNAGIGVKASASLSILRPSTSQASPTTRLSSTASSTTTRPYFTTHAAGASCARDLQARPHRFEFDMKFLGRRFAQRPGAPYSHRYGDKRVTSEMK